MTRVTPFLRGSKLSLFCPISTNQIIITPFIDGDDRQVLLESNCLPTSNSWQDLLLHIKHRFLPTMTRVTGLPLIQGMIPLPNDLHL